MKKYVYLCFLVMLGTLANHTKYKYEMSVISYIAEATHIESVMHSYKQRPKYICELPDEKRLELCKEAWKLDYFREHGYQFLHNETVGPDKVYMILYYHDTSCCNDRKELMSAAFKCPASPPYYLRPGPNNETVYVTVATDSH